MLQADYHTYQVLTKRAHWMLHQIRSLELPTPPHIWLGVSAKNQAMADSWIQPAIKEFAGLPAHRLQVHQYMGISADEIQRIKDSRHRWVNPRTRPLAYEGLGGRPRTAPGGLQKKYPDRATQPVGVRRLSLPQRGRMGGGVKERPRPVC